jgi:hypothetical protein
MTSAGAREAVLPGLVGVESAKGRLAPLLAVAAPVALLVIGLAAFAPALLTQDFWLALVSGREIVEHGRPHVDHLTVMSSGHRWVDQQWLAQLLLYHAARFGGVGLAAAMSLFALAAALWTVGLIAHSRGASPPAIFAFLVACIAAAPWGMQLRPQALAVPMFTLTLFLLLRDPRAQRTSTLWVIPVLCLWSNLHGSAALGVLLVFAYGIQALVRAGDRLARLRALACLVLSPLALLASPYATSLPGYYRLMLLDPPFGRVIREWNRTTPSALTAVFFVLLGVAVVLVVVHRRRLGLFDFLVLGVATAVALDTLRGIVWFGFTCAALLPALATRRPREVSFEGRAAEALVLAAVAATVGAVAWLGVRPANSYTSRFPHALAPTIEANVSGNRERVLADDASADWLLWEVPSLRGRVAYDVRFELLRRGQIARLLAWSRLENGWQHATVGYSLVVADPRHVDALVATRKWRRLVVSSRVEVAVRRGAQTRGRRKPDVSTG